MFSKPDHEQVEKSYAREPRFTRDAASTAMIGYAVPNDLESKGMKIFQRRWSDRRVCLGGGRVKRFRVYICPTESTAEV